jgi:putative methionine-R-sulfoxide reductase with GAF domain
MADRQAYRGALEAVDRILNRGGDVDDVLREVVAVLHDRAGFDWAGIAFVEGERLQLGPAAGTPTGRAESVPVSFEGQRVAELQVEPGVGDDQDGRAFLQRIAVLVSAHCLVGWDTGGDPWQP